MNLIKYLVLAVCLFSAQAITANQSHDSITSFRNVNIIDVNTGTVLNNHYLVLKGDKIEFVGQTLPAHYAQLETEDGLGQFVMPGLIDTHAHISLGELTFKKVDGNLAINAHSSDEIAAWNARELLRYGVTFIRNPGGSSEHNIRYKNKIADGSLLGPNAKIAGEILNQGAFEGLVVDINKNMPLQKAIEQQKAAGIDIIKLYSGLSQQQVQDAIKIGHELDMTVIGHLEEVTWTDAANWQINGLVHAMPISPKLLTADAQTAYKKNGRPGTFAHFEWYEHVDLDSPAMKTLYKALADNQVYIDPTLIVFKNSFYGDSKMVTEHPSLERVHPELVNNWKTFFTFNMGWQEQDFIRAKKVWPKVLGFVKRLYKAGVPMTIGSDLGNPWVIPGLSVHQEMQLFADAGIPNKDILKMATMNAAKHLKIADKHGSITPGKVANLVFLERNPLDDISNTQSIAKVFFSGETVNTQAGELALNLN